MRGAILGLLMACLTGCALSVGTIEPREFTAVSGETVLACETKGIQFSVGDGGNCRVDSDGFLSTQEGGHASDTARDIVLGVFEGAGRIVAGMFGGIGGFFSGIGDAANPQ